MPAAAAEAYLAKVATEEPQGNTASLAA